MKILCLNRNYVPIRFTTRYSAIGKIYCGVAMPIQKSGNEYKPVDFNRWLELSKQDIWPEDQNFINAVSQRIAMPNTIIYTGYEKIPRVNLRLSRKAIYIRDQHTCYICGKVHGDASLTLDHVIPISRGGKTTWENLATCCKTCNANKENKLLNELGIKPKFIPYKPNISNMAKLKATMGSSCCDEWKYFGV